MYHSLRTTNPTHLLLFQISHMDNNYRLADIIYLNAGVNPS